MNSKYKDLNALRIGPLLEQYPAIRLYEAWKSCAGPIFSRCIKFHGVGIHDNKLTVRLSITDPTWKQEFQYQQDVLLQKLQSELKNRGFSNKDLPQAILILAGNFLPSKSGNSKFGGNKK